MASWNVFSDVSSIIFLSAYSRRRFPTVMLKHSDEALGSSLREEKKFFKRLFRRLLESLLMDLKWKVD